MNHEKHEKNEKIVYKEESYKIQGAIFEVYREMGSGFLEAVYQECLETEFTKRGIPFEPQVNIHLRYKENVLQQYYRADIVCYGKIILEIKSVKDLNDIHMAQMLNYLTDVTPILQNPAVCCISRYCGENRNPVLSGVPDTDFRRYDDSA